MSRSSFRRNVAEHLGVASTAVTRQRPPQLNTDAVRRVNEWIRGCDLRWIECASVAAAAELEDPMKQEWKPPLTKR